jgi:PAS domain S-box-containing protein
LDAFDIVATTADPAFATDEEGRIVIWNPAVERHLGYAASDVLGKSCHEIICGRDLFGNRFCDESCALTNMVRRKESLGSFEMNVRRKSGEFVRASITLVVVRGPRPSQYTLIHILRPVAHRAQAEQERPYGGRERLAQDSPPPSHVVAESEPVAQRLTSRELEVLHHLARGKDNREIADTLFISVATVRSHVQHILGKLDVHSKLEAVALALRNRLI